MQIDWPYPFDVVWLAECGHLLTNFLDERPDVFVTTTEQMPRTRCFHGSGAIPVAPHDTVRFAIKGREFAIMLVPDLGETGHAQLAMLSGEPVRPLNIATFDDAAGDVAEAVRRLYEIGRIDRLRAIWQARVDPEDTPIKLGPAQPVWPFGGRRVVKIAKPMQSAQDYYPPYALEFSTPDVEVRSGRLPLPAAAAVAVLSWRSVVADDLPLPHIALRREFLRKLGVRDNAEPRVLRKWPLRDQREHAEEQFPLIDLRGLFDDDVDVGDIVVVCACSVPGWTIDLAAAEQVETLSAREISPSSYGRPSVHFQVLCWRVEPERLVPQNWAELDQRVLPELKKRIAALADDVLELRAKWDDDVRKELSAYPGNPPDFEAVAVDVTGHADAVGVARIFELRRPGAAYNDIVFWLERLPIDQMRNLMGMSGLPIENIVQLLPVSLPDAARAGAEDWRRHEDDAGQLCATLRELWGRLGERDPSFGKLFAQPGPNLRTFTQLPDKIREAKLLLFDDGEREALDGALQTFQAGLLPVDQIRLIHDSVQKFAAALEAAMRAANTIIERLSESLPDLRGVDLAVPTLMATSEATEEDLTDKLPAPSLHALPAALKNIADAAALSEAGRAQLRGAILALAEQGRRVTAIARHFLGDLDLPQAEAYVRSTRSARFVPKGDERSAPSEPVLTPDEEAKLAVMLEQFRSFALEDARPWVHRVLAIRQQLAEEVRLQQVLDKLAQAPPPDPSGKKASNALRSLLVASPGDPGKLAAALDELSA